MHAETEFCPLAKTMEQATGVSGELASGLAGGKLEYQDHFNTCEY